MTALVLYKIFLQLLIIALLSLQKVFISLQKKIA